MPNKKMTTSSERGRFAQRLNDALDNIDFPKPGAGRQTHLSRLLDIPASNVGHWLRGESFPRTSALIKLSDLTKTRSNWLLSGQGEPCKKGDTSRNTGKASPGTDTNKLSKAAVDLGMEWMKLPKQQREAIARVITELLDTKK